MKLFIAAMLLSGSVLAQMPKLPSTAEMTAMSKKIMDACKDDKSKVSGCESYTGLAPLKACLMKNESQLSDTCKSSLKLVK